jgi:phosphoribosylanthranilate isomerase
LQIWESTIPSAIAAEKKTSSCLQCQDYRNLPPLNVVCLKELTLAFSVPLAVMTSSCHQASSLRKLKIKICGLTQGDQARAIAQAGADALGFVCVLESPRYIPPESIGAIVQTLPAQTLQGKPLTKIGVFADASLDRITSTVEIAALTGVQLHGQESPEFCRALRGLLPSVVLIKAFRVKSAETLLETAAYADTADAFLLDAYAQNALGGTGQSWDWSLLQGFSSALPWFLAGGLTPQNAMAAVQQANPPGIDLSSGVERSPGDKDLALVQQLFNLRNATRGNQ